MIKGIYKNHLPASKVLILIGLLLTGFGLSMILALVGVQFLYGFNVLEDRSILSHFSDPEVISALRFMQTIHHIGLFVFPPLAFAYMVSDNFKKYLHLDRSPRFDLTFMTIPIIFTSLPLINFFIDFNGQMELPETLRSIEMWMAEKEDAAGELTRYFLDMPNATIFLLNLFIIGFLPALGEEFLFRGLIQNKLSKALNNYHAGIWIAAFLFSAMHLQFYTFLPRFLLGGLLGYLFVWTGNLWIPIMAHFVNNGGAVFMHYLLGPEAMEESVDSIGRRDGDGWFLFISLLLFAFCLYSFHKMSRKKA